MELLAKHRLGRFLSKGCREFLARAGIKPNREAHCYQQYCARFLAPVGQGAACILVAALDCADISSLARRGGVPG
eukprot:6654613-Lingulodinium_polyedra.AAC.1